MDFKDKVIWITGASSGIGEALSRELARLGARLILSSRNTNKLETLKNQIEKDASSIHILPLDLSAAPDELSKKGEEALAVHGYIDVLINNGGISQRSSVVELDLDVLDRIMKVNFLGAVALTKAVLPSMIERKYGHIVVVSSVMGKFGTQLRSGYAASKHALHGFFDSLRSEVYRDNIKVTLITPGYVKTNVTLNALRGDGSKFGKMEPGQEHGTSPSDCAKKILKAVKREDEETLIGGKEIMGVYLKRFFPKLFSRIIRRMEVH
ncbi:MAG TPA: SDR family oxidoreductase [Balneolales bacterium]|nr:SDR family oxidoreductase [Balneolales bacterium]